MLSERRPQKEKKKNLLKTIPVVKKAGQETWVGT